MTHLRSKSIHEGHLPTAHAAWQVSHTCNTISDSQSTRRGVNSAPVCVSQFLQDFFRSPCEPLQILRGFFSSKHKAKCGIKACLSTAPPILTTSSPCPQRSPLAWQCRRRARPQRPPSRRRRGTPSGWPRAPPRSCCGTPGPRRPGSARRLPHWPQQQLQLQLQTAVVKGLAGPAAGACPGSGECTTC